MSIFDGDDGKAFLFTRTILTKAFYKLVGDHFAALVLEEQTKDEPMTKMLGKMFGSDTNLPDHIQEIADAMTLLADQPVTTAASPDTKASNA